MSPDQLKQYVDNAIQNQSHLYLLYCILSVLGALCGYYLISYFQEKGKNAATREDVGKITSEIESSKSFFNERLEQLKADLASRGHYSRVRYERELKVFEEAWPKLHALRSAVLGMRCALDRSLQAGETEQSRKEVRIAKFNTAFADFQTVTEDFRPFYPLEIWKELVALRNLCWEEATYYSIFEPKQERDYWTKAHENAEAINAQTDKTCEAIRSRLTAFDKA